ncbi:MAG: cell division protein FtsZ [Gammaproteobacteria bacterium]|nr:cell division protein FtsZ [Gammaproteobacteria bacterium]NIR82259.1 cell division protein FtsZ [Gammaproteobacteria bacterium]NIR91190.1 cell division protein FtsZ [Gammaproteobacteria bacterium]NIU03408.1 cell division protein FtsZ [Gammaproteobacteria bacterium]NIX84683.1 cell division protein FtsZ [Gammaproteobacteria bacterium]
MFELIDAYSQNSAVIRVIGVGGGGGNAVQQMLAAEMEGVEFVCANTDAQALKNSSARTILQLGSSITKGLGAGANPEIGRQAALEDRDRIVDLLEGADMVFITAGMGGGTGTGASPVIAQLAKEMGILTVAVVTKPFPFELKRRMSIAEEGIRELSEHVDSLITVPNEKLLSVLGRGISLQEAFRAANDVLLGATQGIAELITRPGMINVDFADVRTVMSEKGRAMMGSGRATGEERARKAAEAAINCPLLDDVNLRGARGILVNVTAGPALGMDEFAAVGEAVGEFASDNALVVIGTVLEDALEDELRVTVVATGLGQGEARAERDMRLVVPAASGDVDYKRFDMPTVMRHTPGKEHAASGAAHDSDYLDIPAFLRRQAD